MKLFVSGVAACVAAGLLGGAAAAEADLEAAINAAVACRAISSDGERLSCLDAAAGGLEAARNELIANKEDKKEGMLARFGLAGDGDDDDKNEDKDNRPVIVETVADFGAEGIYEERHAKLEKKLKEITATTTKITITRKRATLYLDNGQVWRQLDADNKVLTLTDKTDPYPVEIGRSAFGAYMAKVGGINRTIRVRRIK